MSINIKNAKVETLLDEITAITHQGKTETTLKALILLQSQLSHSHQRNPKTKSQRLLNFLTRQVWPKVPSSCLGKSLSKVEEERILGFNKLGV